MELGLCRLHAGPGGLEFGFLFDRIEARQHLVAHDGLADIDQSFADLAADPEGKLGLEPGCNDAGEGDGRGEVDQLRSDGLDPRERPLRGRVLPAAGKQSQSDDTNARQG